MKVNLSSQRDIKVVTNALYSRKKTVGTNVKKY